MQRIKSYFYYLKYKIREKIYSFIRKYFDPEISDEIRSCNTVWHEMPKMFKPITKTQDHPWGQSLVLFAGNPFCKVKAIQVESGHRLSYQYHLHRSEIWIVVQGSATIVLDDEKIFRSSGESIKIPQGSKHRLWNESEEKLMIIEIQLGDSFEEDDIVRLEDDYGREVDQ